MTFAQPLIPARLVKRYKRFLADCELEDGRIITAHCANTGPMTGLVEPGARVWLEPNDDPKKKLNFGWRLFDHENGHFTGVDTAVPNRVVKAALMAADIAPLAAYDTVRPEVKYGSQNSRIDFLLTGEGLPDAYVEVKSVTLRREDGLAEFPDTVTTRGAKHMAELAEMAREGHRAVIFYLVQRTDCTRVTVAADIDPAYGQAVAEAIKAGVEVIAWGTRISPEGVEMGEELPFIPPAL